MDALLRVRPYLFGAENTGFDWQLLDQAGAQLLISKVTDRLSLGDDASPITRDQRIHPISEKPWQNAQDEQDPPGTTQHPQDLQHAIPLDEPLFSFGPHQHHASIITTQVGLEAMACRQSTLQWRIMDQAFFIPAGQVTDRSATQAAITVKEQDPLHGFKIGTNHRLATYYLALAYQRSITVLMNIYRDEPNSTCVRIREMPEHMKPREKLMKHGPATLSDEEILALFISTGSRGSNAIELAGSLIRRHGSLSALGALQVGDLAKQHGIGIAKASRLIACFELSGRISRERIHTETLDSPESIYRSFAPQLQHLPHEQVMIATLDCRLRHLSTHTISIGSVNESIAHPRDILRPAISRGAHGFVLIHNHPSGDPSPSRADHEVTRRVAEAAELMQLRFVDHLIIGKQHANGPAWYSFREAGKIHE